MRGPAIYGQDPVRDIGIWLTRPARCSARTPTGALPAEASSKGVLALIPRVITDLTRLCDIGDCRVTADPDEAIDLYTVALNLIEVTPGSLSTTAGAGGSTMPPLPEKALSGPPAT